DPARWQKLAEPDNIAARMSCLNDPVPTIVRTQTSSIFAIELQLTGGHRPTKKQGTVTYTVVLAGPWSAAISIKISHFLIIWFQERKHIAEVAAPVGLIYNHRTDPSQRQTLHPLRLITRDQT